MPAEPTTVRVEVRPNDDETFDTNLCCALNDCRETVIIESNGPKTVQHVSCERHGPLISFPDQIALGEFVRLAANRILAADGHLLIEAGALYIVGDEQPLPEFMN